MVDHACALNSEGLSLFLISYVLVSSSKHYKFLGRQFWRSNCQRTRGALSVPAESAKLQQTIEFGDDFELDPRAYQLRRSGNVLKLEPTPMEILLFLVEQRGQLVSRERIAERDWGKDVFVDTANSINGALRKIRQVLNADAEAPRFIQTVTGKGYRFVAPIVEPIKEESVPSSSESLIGKRSGR